MRVVKDITIQWGRGGSLEWGLNRIKTHGWRIPHGKTSRVEGSVAKVF